MYRLFTNKSYPDNRGFFFESFSRSISEELEEDFCQDNISYSHKGVVSRTTLPVGQTNGKTCANNIRKDNRLYYRHSI